MGVLRVLGPDQTTVLWDFDDSTGAANPSTVVTNLGAALDLGTIDPALVLELRAHGAAILGSPALPTVEMQIPFMASAATDTALFEGLGQLYRYLLSASRDHPIYLDWTELSATRYIDVVGVAEMPQLIRGQAQAGIVAGRKSSLGPLVLKLLRQPWMRLATVTTSGVTVPNDPATGTKVRVYPVTTTGDLPTPGRVRVQLDSGSAVERILIGHRALKSRAATFFSDYLSETGYANCEASGRGWTATLATGTASTANADASGALVARASTTTPVHQYQRRVRLTRTTLLESLRGTWDVWLRVEAQHARRFRIQLRWGPSTAEPAPFNLPEVIHDTGSVTGSPNAFVELALGRINIPDTVSLGGLALELWTRHESGAAAGDLDLDFIWLVPADSSTVVVPSGPSAAITLGEDLTSPPDAITGDPAWSAGAVSGTSMRLNTANEAAGLGPNTGTDLTDGLNRFIVTCSRNNFTGAGEVRVTNVTDNTEEWSGAFSGTSGSTDFPFTMRPEFIAVAGKSYQCQVTLTSYTTGSLDVNFMSHEFVPALTSGESARTEPGPRRYGVDRLDSSANLAGYLGCEGEVPVLLEPGSNHLMIRCDEVPVVNYDENENDLARTPTVTVAYDPRMAL